MINTLHITSGDSVVGSLRKAGIAGEILVWRDILYDGPPREPGWPDDDTLDARAEFLSRSTGGGLSKERVRKSLADHYGTLAAASDYENLVLWFDACLFDQSMLAHILTCLQHKGIHRAELLCVDAFPGIVPFDGLGQLNSTQLASRYDQRRPVSEAQLRFAQVVDRAFATQDAALLEELAAMSAAPLPWGSAAAARWLRERPDPETGLGRLEQLVLEAIRRGLETPAEIFADVAARDTHPQFWGDTTLWAKINGLADRAIPLVKIEGPAARLPQWDGIADLKNFRITCAAGP
ncbi:MAG: DUF1835 domain-containing protein [Chitinivibrionia bacterium]|nr:DUF1835 domain-containing protein [Chitinivibrionia bacterium]